MQTIVAPRAGAWIETGGVAGGVHDTGSPLAQGRGLKHQAACERADDNRQSPLAQGRGLKLDIAVHVLQHYRSPLAQGRGLKPTGYSV